MEADAAGAPRASGAPEAPEGAAADERRAGERRRGLSALAALRERRSKHLTPLGCDPHVPIGFEPPPPPAPPEPPVRICRRARRLPPDCLSRLTHRLRAANR